MTLRDVDRVDSISKEDFQERYVKTSRPVVIKSLTSNWAAKQKWNYEYFKSLAGDQVVPVYDNSIPTANSAVNKPDGEMKFGEYLDRITAAPRSCEYFSSTSSITFHHWLMISLISTASAEDS
ncbi:MAG TPA: cupin-like domain-containing protein [Cyclobacteriaceae bacterium]